MRLALIGPPGAGKGTQAQALAARFRIPQIASGDLLRAAVRKRTALGLKAKGFMEKGVLVPDELVLGMIEMRLAEPDAQGGFTLDGFPRTVAQAEALARMLSGRGIALDRAVAIIVPDQEIVKRISGRRTCRKCGAMYHVIYDPPSNPGVCNKCQGELYQREDDAEDTVRMRLEVYNEETRPLLAYYGKLKLLAEVNGVGRREEVTARVLEAAGSGSQATAGS